MSVHYDMTTINGRLQATADTIDANGNGFLQLLAGNTLVANFQLARPCGSVAGGVLTLTGTLLDPSAANSGVVNAGRVTDALGNIIMSGLSAGIPGGDADIIIANGLNTTAIATKQVVKIVSAQIVGN